MTDGECHVQECGDDEYEVAAIKAFLEGRITIGDLQVSLELGRAQTYRRVKAFKERGADGLRSGKIGSANNAYSDAFKAEVLSIIHENYADFGPTFAREKLEEKHAVCISADTLGSWMKAEGLWTGRAKRAARIFSPRAPRPRRGELIQVDGSYHRWFEKRGPEGCLLVFIDDATSELKLLEIVDHESSFNYMRALRRYIETFGRPQALYSDRHSIFRATNPNANGVREATQFSVACGKLGIQVICAKTPQAKGRVERANRTLQDRLVKELRLRNISTVEEANRFLDEYRLDHNMRFARPPSSEEDAHRPLGNLSLEMLLTYSVRRKVFKDLSVNFNKYKYILDDAPLSRKAIGHQVTVALYLNGSLDILYGENTLSYRRFDKIRRVKEVPEVADHKRLGAALAMAAAINEVEPHHFKRNAHVLAGFRKFFQEPNDLKSSQLQNAPAHVRRKHRGRARAPLGPHPIVVLEGRLKPPPRSK